jgi:ABC-type branched-subunit amino acid transport system ATPase component/ABC-type branched-subunit amino acid transport system permease subunit
VTAVAIDDGRGVGAAMRAMITPRGNVANWITTRVAVVAALIAAVTVPLWLSLGDEYIAGLAVIAVLFALSYNVMLGGAGMVSFGHAAPYGIGAFTVALITTKVGHSAIEGLILAPFIGAAFGVIAGAFCLRAVRLYFALLTLAVSQLLYVAAFQSYSLTGGDNGIHGIPIPDFLNDPGTAYYFVLAVVAAGALLLFAITKSPFGAALNGIRENRQRAAFVGLTVKRYELAAFVIASSLAAVAGALYAIYDQQAFPGLMYWTASGIPVLMVLIGGMRHFLGPAIGAVFYTFLAAKVQNTTIYWDLIIGAVLLCIVLVLPGGIAGIPARVRDFLQYVRSSRRPVAATPQSAGEHETLAAAAEQLLESPPDVLGAEPVLAAMPRPAAAAPADATILTTAGLVKRFGGLAAVDGVDLHVKRGGVHAVIGPNGAGKSTLFNLISGQTRPDAGTVWFDGGEVTGSAPQRLVRAGLGRSFQTTAVFPGLTALENVRLAMMGVRGDTRAPVGRAAARHNREALETLEVVGLREHRDVRASDLSHGDQRALELAISLAVGARLLVLDEPTAGMSPYETRRTLEMLRRLITAGGITLLFTEHDMEVVFGIADRVTVMAEGRVLVEGSPTEVRVNPEVIRIYLGEETPVAVGAAQ